MTKRIVTMSIDEEVHNAAKKLDINISATVEEMLGQLVNRKSSEVGGINLELKKLEKTELEKQITNLAGRLKSVLLTIESVEEKHRRIKEQELIKEKENIEKQISCFNCGDVFGEEYKWTIFGTSRICQKCYLDSDAKQIKKWGES